MGHERGRPGRPTVSQAYMLRNAFKFIIAPHKQKSIVKKNVWLEDGPPGQRSPVLKHNGKSGTDDKS